MNHNAAAYDEPVLRRPRLVRWFADRPRIADVVVILACTVPAVAALILSPPPHAWLGYLCVAGIAVAFWWRRSHPLIALIVVLALATLNPSATTNPLPAFVEVVFAVYAVAAFARLPVALLGFLLSEAVIFAASYATVLLDFREDPASIGLRPTSLVALALGIAVRASRSRRMAIEEVIALREDRAAAMERARITAEMHDVVAHSVTVMIALAGGAAAGWEKHPERARHALDQLSTVGANTLEEMQRILRVLRENDDDLDRNLQSSGHDLPSLDELVEVFRTAGLPVALTVCPSEHGPLPDADPALRTTVYRIVQEALTNALRHARDASRVDVEVVYLESHITVTVTDDGHGAALGPSVGAGVGLRAMRERAAAFHGEFEAGPMLTSGDQSRPGWRTRVSLPVRRHS
ncbi:sensor histidine kinase [Microbacterium oxydans]|uniref:sensor histidine kinase n=1 Tax=Microbacterium oxydans TaxID=82380 RepID=UPI00226B70FF|nr:histidine kinase [Microbacterium oxydans]WAA65622.1 histidine kinase [Microbacterium oxydans]